MMKLSLGMSMLNGLGKSMTLGSGMSMKFGLGISMTLGLSMLEMIKSSSVFSKDYHA